MPRPSADTFQSSLRELYAHLDLDTLPTVAATVACRLVDCDATGYNEIDTVRKRAVGVVLPDGEAQQVFANLPMWERYMHQHPLLQHFRAFPYDRPRKITDFITQAEFEALDLYREFFGPLGFRYQIVTAIPTRSTIAVGISQNRRRRDFTESDRRTLETLWPHLCQAYENAATVSELRLSASRHEIVMDRLDRGQIVIDADACVQHATPAAVRFLGEFLSADPLTATQLPRSVEPWARRQIATLTRDGIAELAHPEPLLIAGPHGTLERHALLQPQAQHVDDLAERLRRGLSDRAGAAGQRLARAGGGLRPAVLQRKAEATANHIAQLGRLLGQLNPDAPLRRGYARIMDRTGKTLTSAAAATRAGALNLKFSDAEIAARVEGAPRRVYAPPQQPNLFEG